MAIKFRKPLGVGVQCKEVYTNIASNNEEFIVKTNQSKLIYEDEEYDSYDGEHDYNADYDSVHYTDEKKEKKRKFYNNSSGVFRVKDNKEISRDTYLEKIYVNRDNSEHKATIKFKSLSGYSEVTVSRNCYLNKKNLMDLQKVGLDITHDNNKYMAEYLRECEDYTPVRYTHSKLGFSEYNGKMVYKLYSSTDRKSIYDGKYKIEPKGSREKYLNMMREQVFGNTELEFSVTVGLSSIILAYLDENLGSPIVHLVGNSTTGKSTALKLAISCFGCPNSNYDGLYGTYNGTNNALLKKIGGLNGVPYALDEISMSNTENFTKFIYSLANGSDKERLNSDSELKEKESWLTMILSNGEKSIIRSSNKNAGVQIRVIEAENFKWTKSAENADEINSIIQNNYGFLGIEFATYILRKDKNKLINQYKIVRDDLIKKFESIEINDSMTQRRCNTFAIIVQTALILEDMLKVKLDVKGIINMIIRIEESSLKQRDFKRSAIDFIKQYVEKNRSKFIEGENIPKNETLGIIRDKNEHLEIQMDKISFAQMIKEGGYEDEKVVLNELKEGGFLNCDRDRYTRKRKNSLGIKAEVVVINIDK